MRQSFLFLKQFSFEKVHKHMKSPIHVYYQLDNFYQNHRRYVTTLVFMLQTFISTVSNPHLQSEGKRSFYETRISWFFSSPVFPNIYWMGDYPETDTCPLSFYNASSLKLILIPLFNSFENL